MPPEAKPVIAYIDTGGTFTDIFVVCEDGKTLLAKTPTTPADLTRCFLAAIEKAAEKAGLSDVAFLQGLQVLGYGSTIAINTMLTRSGARVGLITTRGAEDVTIMMCGRGRWIGRSPAEIMHTAGTRKPAPLVPRPLIKGVTERIDTFGKVLVPLYEHEARAAAEALVAAGVEGIVVGTLFSFLNGEHEQRIAEIAREVTKGHIPITESRLVASAKREWPRFTTALIEAQTSPKVHSFYERVGKVLESRGYQKPLLVMQSTGGVASAQNTLAVHTLQSGPVGGLIGTKVVAGRYGYKNAIASDVGGTSFDVSLVIDGEFQINTEPVVDQFVLSCHVADIKSIGAGGGTIAGIDPLSGRIFVGPKSAGADPGPVAYGKGGTQPTVTDADLVLGYLNPNNFLGGELKLDKGLAEQAILRHIAEPLNLSLEEAAYGIRQIIDSQMRDLVRDSVQVRGLDLRDFALFAFGGAGPTHVCDYAAGLPLKDILIFPYSAVFSAFGASSADISHRYNQSLVQVIPPEGLSPAEAGALAETLNAAWAALEQQMKEDVVREGFALPDVALTYTVEMKYGGQLEHTVAPSPVSRVSGPDDLRRIVASFEATYARLYSEAGKEPEAGFEIEGVGLTVSIKQIEIPAEKSPLCGESAARALKSRRRAYFDHRWHDTGVYDMALLEPGNRLVGPAVVEAGTTTIVVPPGREVLVDEYRVLHMRSTVAGVDETAFHSAQHA